MPEALVTASGEGFTVLSPATGQATIWVATAAEAQRWTHALERGSGSPRQPNDLGAAELQRLAET